MRIKVRLSNAGGELAADDINVSNTDLHQVSEAIKEIIAQWELSPGDTITITEE